MKFVLHILLVLAILTLIQQGPAMLALSVRLPVEFRETSPNSVSADLGRLPAGRYYLSAGRVVNSASAYLDGVPISIGTLTLGSPFEIASANRPHRLDISWTGTSWRDQLFDFPVVTSYAVGNLLQTWRTFNDVYLGTVAAVLMLISALVHARISRAFAKRMRPHVLVAFACLVYSFVLSGIPDLFWGFVPTLTHIVLRIAVSASIVYLLGYYSRRTPGTVLLLAAHIPLVVLATLTASFWSAWLNTVYQMEIVIIGVLTFIAGVWLSRASKEESSRLLAEFAIAWAILHVLAVSSTLRGGWGSYLSVWTPSFFAVLACLDLYLISVEAIGFEGEAVLARQSVRIAGQVAHDIRSPLAALRTVMSHLQISSEEKQLASMAFERIDGIAGEILTVYRGTTTRGIQKVKLLPVVESLLKEKKAEISDSRRLVLDCGQKESDLYAFIETSQMKRILSNLLNNAISATRKGDGILIRIASQGRYVNLGIVDTGSGITPERLSAIQSKELPEGSSGHGLGLSHAFSYVESWGGKIEVESAHGAGTTVTVKLLKG